MLQFLALAAVVGSLAVPSAAAPLQEPYRVLVGPNGSLLIADGRSGRIVRVNPESGARTVYARGLGRVTDLSYGPRRSLYVVNGSRVVRFSAKKTKRVVARGFSSAFGIAVAANGSFYVVDTERNRVFRFAGGKRKVVASTGLDQPLGIAIGTNGVVYVADSHHGRIVRIAPGRRLEPVVTGLELPASVTAEPDGSLLIVDHVRHDRPGKILRRLPSGELRTLSSGAIMAVTSADVARDGTAYATSFLAPFLGRVDAGGRLEPLGG